MKKKDFEQQRIEELERKFFGVENALQLTENIQGKPEEIREDIYKQEQKVLDLGSQNDPEFVIDRMQQEEVLPESIHTPVLVKLLKFLGDKLDFKVIIDNKTVLYPQNEFTLNLSGNNLKTFLKRGAIAAGFLMPFLMAEKVAYGLAAGPVLNEGDSLIEHVDKAAPQPGYEMFHWEHIVTILVILGLTTAAIYAIYRWLKKKKKITTATPAPSEATTTSGPNPPKPPIMIKLEEYRKAVERKDRAAIESAKEEIMNETMGELPSDMDDVKSKITKINKEEIEVALEVKKGVDELINLIAEELAAKMLLPEEITLENLNLKKQEVIYFMTKVLAQLEALWDELYKLFQDLPDGSYLKAQLHIEKQKLNYMMKYLDFILKKWLIYINEAKQEVLKGHTGEGLEKEDKILQQLGKLKNNLVGLLNQQINMSPEEFAKQLDEIQKNLDSETKIAKDAGMVEFQKGVEFIDGLWLVLENDGYFDKDNPVDYTVIEGANDPNQFNERIELSEKVEIQIWVDINKNIKMNFTHDGVLVDKKELTIKNKRLVIKENGQTLADYIKERSENDEVKGIATSNELPKEAEPVLKNLASAVISVKNRIKHRNFETFGEKIDVDDEVIEYHHIRIHEEYFEGKAKAVVKFNLSESHWKNALSHLNKQKDVPLYPVTYNYENETGAHINISLPVRRFNVIVNGKQAIVLIADNTSKNALFGEVRIIFNVDTDYTEDDIKKVFAEVAIRLGIGSAVKPVNAAADKNLVTELQKIRKDNAQPAVKKYVTEEYTAHNATPAEVMKMKEAGLHSLYHQFNLEYLEDIFKTGSLLCTTTRFSKGIFVQGMSSTSDIETGGGTEAYFRVHTDASLHSGTWYSSGKAVLLYKPDLFNRMDCYCFTCDKYGSKKPGTFEQRVSPMQLVKKMKSSYNTGNEVMFHDAVPVQEASYLVCNDPSSVKNRLKKIGITHIGGNPIEQAVITFEQARYIKF